MEKECLLILQWIKQDIVTVMKILSTAHGERRKLAQLTMGDGGMERAFSSCLCMTATSCPPGIELGSILSIFGFKFTFYIWNFAKCLLKHYMKLESDRIFSTKCQLQ